MTHAVAHRERKPPFFFSRFKLQKIQERGNTHYCFHCGGDWGFTPDKEGNPTNRMDSRISLQKKDGGYVLIEEALRDVNLEPHITNSPGYPRHNPEEKGYKEWLSYRADFDHTSEFEAWCKSNEYIVHRYDPMKHHDLVTHANGVVDGAEKYRFASNWLEKKIGPDFPYVVSIT